MSDPSAPAETPQPVQPFVPGRRPKRMPRPPGPIRRFLARQGEWRIAAALCLPAVAAAAVDRQPWWLQLFAGFLFLSALLLPGAVRRGRWTHALAAWLPLSVFLFISHGIAMAEWDTSQRTVAGMPGLFVLDSGMAGVDWLLMHFILLLAIGVSESMLSGPLRLKRLLRLLPWVSLGALAAEAWCQVAHEALWQTGWLMAGHDAHGVGGFRWLGPSFATLRALALWIALPAALRMGAKGQRRSRLLLLGAAVSGGGAVLLISALMPMAPPEGFTRSAHSTILTEPLHPNGTIDYLSVVNRELAAGVPQQDNAAVELVRALGPRAVLPKSGRLRGRVLTDLGVPQLPTRGQYFVSFPTFLEHNKLGSLVPGGFVLPWPPTPGTSQPTAALEALLPKAWIWHESGLGQYRLGPWHASIHEEDKPLLAALTAYLEAQEKPLAHFLAAAGQKHYHMPVHSADRVSSLAGVQAPCLGDCLAVASVLALRAMQRAFAGDGEAACRDVVAMHRVARLMSSGGRWAEHLVANWLSDYACRTTFALAHCDRLGAEQLRRLAEQLDRLPPAPLRRIPADHERYAALDQVMQMIRRGAVHEDSGRLPRQVVDWDEVLRLTHFWMGAASAGSQPDPSGTAESVAGDRPTLGELREAYRAMHDRRRAPLHWLQAMVGGPRRARLAYARRLATAVTVPEVGATDSSLSQLWRRALARAALARIAVAIEHYRRDHGRFAPSLQALIPRYLQRLPECLAGHPVVYKLAGRTYALSCTGWSQVGLPAEVALESPLFVNVFGW
jgi:hypothetical protein